MISNYHFSFFINTYILNKWVIIMNKLKSRINILSFEFIFKIITILIGYPIIKGIIHFIKNTFNIDYISLYNIKHLTHNVLFDIIILLIMLFVSLYFIFDVSCILLMLNNKKHYIKESLFKVLNIFKLKNILYLIYPSTFISFIILGINILSYKYITPINSLINMMIYNNTSYICIVFILIIHLLLLITGLNAFHEYILNDKSFIEYNKNINIVNNIFKVIIIIIRKTIPYIIIYYLMNILTDTFFNIRSTNNSILEGIIISTLLISLLLYYIYSFISDLSYLNKGNKVKYDNNINYLLIIINIIIIMVINVLFVHYMDKYNEGATNNRFIYDYDVTITAHRGASEYAPENSMAAFKKANKLDVPYIELDVHLSKDGYLYIMHDNNLNRVLGINKPSDKIKYVDIKDSYLISRFPEYQEEKVPLLEDVLKWAKDKDFILNIELKPMDNTLLLTDKVVEMVHNYKMSKKVIIASFDVPSILRVKELDDKLKIVYLGNTYQYNELFDYYSINYSGLTTAVVDKIHKNDKKVFAWTINDPKLVKSLLYMNVDNIITNDPIMVKEVIDKYKDRNKITVLFDFILNI